MAGISSRLPQRQTAVSVSKPDVDNNADDINVRPTGTSVAYAHRRLRRQRPDLHQRVLDGEMTANAAMVEAGFRKKRASKRKPRLDEFALIQKLDAIFSASGDICRHNTNCDRP